METALEMRGGYGYSAEYHIEGLFNHAKISKTYA
ncbi:MAG: hypothetical protein IME95_00070 [Proteobacteria bacterium]|nr:hypothetical protein [Pseudomonadota bacterium]